MKTRYFITLPDTEKLAGDGDSLRFASRGAEGIAAELQAALREGGVFAAWLRGQDNPDDIDPRLAENDPAATVEGQLEDLSIKLVVTTTLNGEAFRHRMRLLAGNHWQLRDVTAA